MNDYFAHSENSPGIKHDRVEHLTSVAERAAEFAGKFGAEIGRTDCGERGKAVGKRMRS
jgi:hypothetical protein